MTSKVDVPLTRDTMWSLYVINVSHRVYLTENTTAMWDT